MTIPRFQLVELEDLAWFPPVIRDLATDYLHFMEAKMTLHRPVVPLLADPLRQTRAYTAEELATLAASLARSAISGTPGRSGTPNRPCT